jgi:hypothetical protein
MRAIVDGVARDHEIDRGYVQAGRVIGIGVADVDGLVAFKVECCAFQPFGGDEFRRDPSRKSTTPDFDGFRREKRFREEGVDEQSITLAVSSSLPGGVPCVALARLRMNSFHCRGELP